MQQIFRQVGLKAVRSGVTRCSQKVVPRVTIPIRTISGSKYHFSAADSQSSNASQSTSEKSTTTTADSAASESNPETPAEEDPLVKALKRIEELEAEAKANHEKLLRSYAEEENVRRIARKDVADAKAYANSSFAKSLLDVSDNIERALTAISEDKMKGDAAEASLKTLMEGVVMINKDLTKVFTKFHVKQYGAVGDTFDPNIHEALFKMPKSNDDQVENSIGQVIKTGYKLNDRVIRAAEVGIITSPE